MSNTSKYSISLSSLESSSLKMSNQVVHVSQMKDLDPPLPAFGLKSTSTISPLFVKKLFSDNSLYDEAEQIQLSAAEIQSFLSDLPVASPTADLVSKAGEKIAFLRTRVDKVLETLSHIEKTAEHTVAERLEKMHSRVTRSADREVLAKQKVEQIKAKYKLKKYEMKKELKKYKKHYEASKKVWAEKMRILQKEADEQRVGKEKYIGLYLDKLAEIDTELSAILSESHSAEKIDPSPVSFRPESTLKSKLRKLKENIVEYRNQKPWADASLQKSENSSSVTPPASQSASLNKAFVQSGTMGELKEESKSGNNSKLSISQNRGSIAPLSDSQMKKYFGSNHTLLSVTQREKILYSLINRSLTYETGGGNDVRIEDVLNISKAGSVKATPYQSKGGQLLVMDDSSIEGGKGMVTPPGEGAATKGQQQDLSEVKCQQSSIEPSGSLIETPVKFQEPFTDNKKKDDTLEISFKENLNAPSMADLINEAGDTLKDLNEAISSDKPLLTPECEPEEKKDIDSLELSAIVPPISDSPIFPLPTATESKDENFDHKLLQDLDSDDIIMNRSIREVKRAKTFLSKTANELPVCATTVVHNKSFGAVPDGKFLPEIKPMKPVVEKKQSPPEKKQLLSGVIGGKKVTLFLKRPTGVNQTVDCIDRGNPDTSTDTQHNITTVTVDPAPMQLKLVKRRISTGKRVSLAPRTPGNILPANNKSLSEIPVSPNLGQYPVIQIGKVKTPQKIRARFNAFTIVKPGGGGMKKDEQKPNNEVKQQQTPEFSSKGESIRVFKPDEPEKTTVDNTSIQAINNAISKIIQSQTPATVVNINIQTQTSYNSVPRKVEPIEKAPPLVAPMKIVRRIRSLKSAEGKKMQLKKNTSSVTKDESGKEEGAKQGSPQVAIYRRKKYVKDMIGGGAGGKKKTVGGKTK